MACVHFSFLLQFIDMNADREARHVFLPSVLFPLKKSIFLCDMKSTVLRMKWISFHMVTHRATVRSSQISSLSAMTKNIKACCQMGLP